MLLGPLRFSDEADEQIWFLLHVISTTKIDVSTEGPHYCASVAETRTRAGCLHRERKPAVEILERCEVRLAADFRQDVGIRHSLSSREEEEKRCVERERNHSIFICGGLC